MSWNKSRDSKQRLFFWEVNKVLSKIFILHIIILVLHWRPWDSRRLIWPEPSSQQGFELSQGPDFLTLNLRQLSFSPALSTFCCHSAKRIYHKSPLIFCHNQRRIKRGPEENKCKFSARKRKLIFPKELWGNEYTATVSVVEDTKLFINLV